MDSPNSDSGKKPLEAMLENLNIEKTNENPGECSTESECNTVGDKPNFQVVQLKITLMGISPKVWRRIQVPSFVNFKNLSDFIQTAIGWKEEHDYQFVISTGDLIVSEHCSIYPDTFTDTQTDILKYLHDVGDKVVYIYDMDDGWWDIVLECEAILPRQPELFYPRCVGGKRAAPPEDCGGPDSYQYLLKVIADPSHTEYEAMTSWLNKQYPGFEPDLFNADQVFSPTVIYQKYNWLIDLQ